MEPTINMKIVCGCGHVFKMDNNAVEIHVIGEAVGDVFDKAYAHASLLHHTLNISGEIRANKPVRERYHSANVR